MLRILILILFCAPHFLWSQAIESEEDLIEKANEFFEEGSYMQALPLFSQLVSLNPKNTNYNYKFGTCVIYSGVDKETAIKHLTFATKKNERDPRAYYFLGLAKHENYEFREAKKAYGEFLKKADDKLKAKFDAQRQIEMCTNGEGLLSNLTDLVVLDKKEVAQSDFFRYYELAEIGGKVIAKPEALITKRDKKKGLKGVVHFTAGSEYLYFSSYGKDGDDMNLYRVKPLSDGEFSKPELLKGDVNTKFDEDFAFMHSDGETLYFASKGHSSMGGYDVFKCVYDRANDTYTAVENLDFAINTPDDDLFYLVDSTKTIAYFASGRNSSQDNLNVYKVRVESLPLDFVVLQGEFMVEAETGSKDSKITVYDEFTGLKVGDFYTDPNTGKYDIQLERAGTYRFNIESDGSDVIHQGIVEVPVYDEPVALRQGLTLSDESGTESLKISNYFEEPLDVDIAELAQEMLRKKAGLDVNADLMASRLEAQKEQERLAEESANAQKDKSEAGVAAGFGNDITVEELAVQMKATSDELAKQSDFLKTRAKEAYAESQIKKQLAEEKLAQGKQMLADADESNPEQYNQQVDEGNRVLAESRRLSMEAQSLIEVVKSVDAYSEELSKESSTLNQNSKTVAESSDFNEIVEILKEEKTRQRESSKEDASSPETTASNNAEFKKKELDNLLSRIDKLREDEVSLTQTIDAKKKLIANTSKKSVRENLEVELQALENELIVTKEDIEDETDKITSVQIESESFALQRQLLNNLNRSNYDFQGDGQDYDLAKLDSQISQIKGSALEAQNLIPENYTMSDTTGEGFGPMADLASIQAKTGANSTEGVQLNNVELLKEEHSSAQKALSQVSNDSEKNAKLAALDRQLEKKLSDQLVALDQVMSSDQLSNEELVILENEMSKVKEELRDLNDTQIAENTFTPEESFQIAETYAPESKKSLENWRTNEPSFEDIETASALKQQLSQDLEKALLQKNQEIIASTNTEEVIALNEEVQKLEAAKKEVDQMLNSKEFLADVYEAELAAKPENSLGISESYRRELENRIINLDQSSSGLSDSQKAENRKLKNELSLELTTVSNTIRDLEQGAATASSESTGGSETASTSEESIVSSSGESESTTSSEEEASADGYVSIPVTNINSETVDAINPSYAAERSSIESKEGLSDKERLEEKIKLDQELVAELSDQIQIRAARLDATEDETVKEVMQSEINAIQTVKQQKIQNVEVMNSSLTQITAEELASANDPTIQTGKERAESANILDNSELSVTQESEVNYAEEKIKQEVEALPREVKEAFTANVTVAEEPTADELRVSKTYKELLYDNPELKAAEKNQREIVEIREFIQSIEQTVTANEEEEKARLKGLEKAKARLSKMETKISPQVLNVASDSYTTKLAEVDNNLAAKTSSLPADHPVFAQVENLRKEAELYNEDAQIYEDLAKGNKKNSLEQSEKYNEATAKRMAAIENINRAEWLLENAEDLASVSPETMERMMEDESLTAVEELAVNETVEPEEIAGPEVKVKKAAVTFEEKLLDLDNDVSNPGQLGSKWDVSPQELEKMRSSTAFIDYQQKSDKLSENFVTLVGSQSQINSAKTRGKYKNKEADQLEEEMASMATEEEKAEAATQIQKLRAAAQVYYDQAEQLEKDRQTTFEESLALKSDLQNLEKTMDPNYDPSTELLAEETVTPEEPEEVTATEITDPTVTEESEVAEETLAETTEEAAETNTNASESSEESTEETIAESTDQPEETAGSTEQPEETLIENTVPAEEAAIAEAASVKTIATAESVYKRSLDLSKEEDSSVFSITKDVYNDDRPIPVNVSLPEGVVFKVQIGAFRNPIPQTLYSDFAPVMGEELSNGITRYTAGMFKEFSVANDAKSDVRSFGYSDAFVVAYRNGERIPLSEAKQQTAANSELADTNSNSSESSTNSSSTPNTENSVVNSSNQTGEEVNGAEPAVGGESEAENTNTTETSVTTTNPEENTTTTPEITGETAEFNPSESSDDYYERFPDAAEANQIEVLKGLFYTVQIGVYSKPVPSKDIYNISPLNSELLANSRVRYSSGIYNNLETAISRKEEIQSTGIEDAFVTAYFNGKRITIAEAKRKFQESGVDVLEVTNQVSDNATPAVKDKYVIYIGSFKDEVPANIAKAMLFLEDSRGIVQVENGDEVAYYTKVVASEQTAKIIKQEFASYQVFSVQIQKVKRED